MPTREECDFIKRSFVGRRTNAVCLQNKCTDEDTANDVHAIYQDIQSLDLAVQLYDCMPAGKPRWVEFK